MVLEDDREVQGRGRYRCGQAAVICELMSSAFESRRYLPLDRPHPVSVPGRLAAGT
jgi:hypothetical protein